MVIILALVFLLQITPPSLMIVSPDGVRLTSTPAVLEAPSIYVLIKPDIGITAYNQCMMRVGASPMSCEFERVNANKADADIRFANAIQALLSNMPIIQVFRQYGIFVVAPGVTITPFGPEPTVPPAGLNPFPGE